MDSLAGAEATAKDRDRWAAWEERAAKIGDGTDVFANGMRVTISGDRPLIQVSMVLGPGEELDQFPDIAVYVNGRKMVPETE